MMTSNLSLALIGGPTVLIEFDGVRLLTDPDFDPPGLYQETSVRFEKTSGPACRSRRSARSTRCCRATTIISTISITRDARCCPACRWC